MEKGEFGVQLKKEGQNEAKKRRIAVEKRLGIGGNGRMVNVTR